MASGNNNRMERAAGGFTLKGIEVRGKYELLDPAKTKLTDLKDGKVEEWTDDSGKKRRKRQERGNRHYHTFRIYSPNPNDFRALETLLKGENRLREDTEGLFVPIDKHVFWLTFKEKVDFPRFFIYCKRRNMRLIHIQEVINEVIAFEKRKRRVSGLNRDNELEDSGEEDGDDEEARDDEVDDENENQGSEEGRDDRWEDKIDDGIEEEREGDANSVSVGAKDELAGNMLEEEKTDRIARFQRRVVPEELSLKDDMSYQSENEGEEHNSNHSRSNLVVELQSANGGEEQAGSLEGEEVPPAEIDRRPKLREGGDRSHIRVKVEAALSEASGTIINKVISKSRKATSKVYEMMKEKKMNAQEAKLQLHREEASIGNIEKVTKALREPSVDVALFKLQEKLERRKAHGPKGKKGNK